jgi:polyamine oxidase
MTTVIIIGAGVSGLEAAANLTKAGVNVLMIEARGRIGGRTFTYKTGDGGSYDLGASWLHNTLDNELFDFSLDHGVKTNYNDNATIYFDPNGEIKFEETHPQAALEIMQKAQMDYEEDFEKEDVSLKDYALRFAVNRRSYTETNRRIAPQIARVLELYHGIEWEKISTRYGLLEHSGRDAFVLDNYDTVLKHIFARIDKSRFKLILNSPIKIIDTIKSGRSRVVTRNGTEYFSKYVICTVPLGVLKKRSIQFTPPLSQELNHAIDSLEMAALGKVVFEFDSVFWPPTIDRFMSLAQKDGPVSETWTVPVYFVNAYKMTGRPSLITLTAPPLTQYLEANPSMANSYYKPLLEALRVDKTKPLPKISNTIVTSWTQDEFALGSYSAFPVGIKPDEVFSAFLAGAGQLRFAGEHTSPIGTACTHGAFHSGQREAANILELEGKTPNL